MEFNNNNDNDNNSYHLISTKMCQTCTKCIKYNLFNPHSNPINISILQLKKLRTNEIKCNDQGQVANKPLS